MPFCHKFNWTYFLSLRQNNLNWIFISIKLNFKKKILFIKSIKFRLKNLTNITWMFNNCINNYSFYYFCPWLLQICNWNDVVILIYLYPVKVICIQMFVWYFCMLIKMLMNVAQKNQPGSQIILFIFIFKLFFTNMSMELCREKKEWKVVHWLLIWNHIIIIFIIIL